MEYGICNLTVVPLRADEAHRSEMVSQVIFGETFEILARSINWTKVRTTSDSYIGWIQNGQFLTVDDVGFCAYQLLNKKYIGFEGGFLSYSDHHIQLLHGTFLREGFSYCQENDSQEFTVQVLTLGQEDFVNKVSHIAKQYWGAPYLWGGRSKFGIDCSGFSQLVYQSFGYQLPRDAYQQAEIGNTVDFLTEIQVGDLAFFDNEEGKITHVGVMLDSGTIIHASSCVRIDRMDQEGIFNKELNKYTHKLRIVKRYISE
ncbi:C40 family peptidase [Sphingobacterium sp. SRCM116780]|uniref:C40 family peptidase n=1 Tax=Sphingobacterium sp. SRCM116780 TaxID=2907623 RepID=UPI001F412518|nr:C40 family peptidase [Sphingobacterium sp. SRCM116780]UIR57240.1 C40 family peptidase [Sphingobacterium sp. SRCM116780]